MSIPREYVDAAKTKLNEIDQWFAGQVGANPGNVLALVAQRAKRINEEIYEHFTNQRVVDYKKIRDVNSLRLSCRAGRGRPFGSVPRASNSGTVNRDTHEWTYDSHDVHVHSSLRGSHNVNTRPDGTGCDFHVSCVGVAFEDTTRGHGSHDATLHVTFKMTEEAIAEAVQIERISLQRELGL